MFIACIILALVAVLVKVGDWITTARALASGHAQETNPVTTWLIARIGFTLAFAAEQLLITLVAIGAVWVASLGFPYTYAAAFILLSLAIRYALVDRGNWEAGS